MKHLSQGELRAYLDQAADTRDHSRAAAHLATCPRCQAQARAIQVRAEGVNAHLASLDAGISQPPLPAGTARRRLAARISDSQKEKQNMWNKLTSRSFRPVWIVLAVVALLAVSMAFEPVRAVANSFLGLFRVEQIRVVEVDPDKLSNQFAAGSQFDQLLSQDTQVEEFGEPQEVASADEASQAAGFTVRLPSAAQSEPKLVVQPGSRATFTVDMELVKAVLQEIGQPDIKLPADLNGAKIVLDVPTSVIAQYGECKPEQAPPSNPDNPQPVKIESFNCTSLVQLPSPTISAPPGLDMTAIGEAYLQILGMDKAEAHSFASNVDWTTTFVVPIPQRGTQYQDVQVDGVTGTLVWQSYRDEYALMWVKNGILYGLSGPGDSDTALELAGSIK
jgi:hypothetical protein